jgi:KDO2-lipid IV(A) lauroyltransferase
MSDATAVEVAEPPRRRRRKDRRAVRNWIEYTALVSLTAVVKAMPFRLASWLGARGGATYGWICRVLGLRDHRVATTNLRLAYPEKTEAERQQIIRDMWRTWGRFSSDAIQLLKITPEQLRERVRVEPQERFLEIKERVKRRGVLVLTAHFGSFELLHAAVSAYGVPVTLVHRPMTNPAVDTWIRALRGRFGTHVLARGEAARDVLRALRDGTIVAIPFDQAAKKDIRVWAPFFNVMVSTNSGLARLAQVSGAPVYPVVLIRDGESNTHRVYIGPEVPIVKTGDKEKDILATTIQFNKALEGLIRQRPDHWIWMYRRFKQRPDGGVSPYLPWAPPIESYRLPT